MNSINIVVSLMLVILVGAQDVEVLLAQKNIEGYPSSLLFDSVSSQRNDNEVLKMDKNRLSQLLESREVRAAVTRAALQYSAEELNKSGQARYLGLMSDDPGMCSYSWISWLPWMLCDAPPTPDTTKEATSSPSSLPLVSDSSPKCY